MVLMCELVEGTIADAGRAMQLKKMRKDGSIFQRVKSHIAWKERKQCCMRLHSI